MTLQVKCWPGPWDLEGATVVRKRLGLEEGRTLSLFTVFYKFSPVMRIRTIRSWILTNPVSLWARSIHSETWLTQPSRCEHYCLPPLCVSGLSRETRSSGRSREWATRHRRHPDMGPMTAPPTSVSVSDTGASAARHSLATLCSQHQALALIWLNICTRPFLRQGPFSD